MNPWVDSVFNANGEDHNRGMAYGLRDLQDSAAVYGPLTNSKSEAIVRVSAEVHLAAMGLTLTDSDFLGAKEARERHFAGEDIVGRYHPDGWSGISKELGYRFVGAAGQSPSEIKTIMQDIAEQADMYLSGTEREAIVAAAGIGYHSADYWSTNMPLWDEVLVDVTKDDNCVNETIAGDIAGAWWGSRGGWAGVILGAIGGSIAAHTICKWVP